MLLMPAWRAGGALGVKVVTVFPDNAARGLGAVQASYLLMDADTGELRAVVDGNELTLRRTACASAMASRYLSRADADTLLMVGTGKLAPHLVAAHAAVRRYSHIRVWGRSAEKAGELAARLGPTCDDVRAVDDLESAVRAADVISCATLSDSPLVEGDWLAPGQHLDLVGAFTPDMREADSAALARATVFADTYDGAFSEAGDIIRAIDDGAITRDDVVADLAELARGEHEGRTSAAEITLFKSVGTALEDLAAAELVCREGE